MLRLALLSFFALLQVMMAGGQSRESILPASNFIHKTNWRDSVYLLPRFQPGEIIFDTGVAASQKFILNLNLFTQRMDAIAANGDTLTLKPFKVPHLIKIGNHLFYYDLQKGYLESIVQGKVSLVRLSYRYAEYAGYLRYYPKQKKLYMISNHKVYTSDRLHLIKLHHENEAVVKQYLDNHEVDFSKEEDLAAVVERFNGLGRNPEKGIPGMFRVKTGDPFKREWGDSLYLFPQFEKTSVTYSDGSKSGQLLLVNYNLLTNKLDWLRDSGDTVELANQNIYVMSVGNQLFYKYQFNGYAEVLVQGPQALCAIKRLKLVQKDINPNAAPIYHKAFRADADDSSFDRLYIMEISYQFLNRDQKWFVANKATFIKFFPQKQKQINTYLRSHPVNFRSKNDLLQLLSFCNQL